jgi:hypothetical protein
MHSMSAVTANDIIDLHFEDRDHQVRITLPDLHIMVLAVEQAARACGVYQRQKDFEQQFNDLLCHLKQWCDKHRDHIQSAFVSLRDGGILFLAVQKPSEYSREFEDTLTDLDVEIANSASLDLIRLSVLALPHSSADAVESFLTSGAQLRLVEYGD